MNGRAYAIGCDDGQEEHITKLARYFDTHVTNLTKSVGQIGEQRLFLMAAILLADEAHELREKLHATEAEVARLKDVRQGTFDLEIKEQTNIAKKIEATASKNIKDTAELFDNASKRIEELAQKLDEA